MCLSTPITPGADDKTTTNSTNYSPDSCVNNNNNDIKTICTLNTARHNDGDDDSSNSISIRKGICCNQKQGTVNNNVTTKANSDEEKDDDENAVYKEISLEEESIKAIQTNPFNDIEYNPQIRWLDLIAQIFLHAGALYGLFLLFQAKFYTILWVTVIVWCSGIGITAGAHRLWSHKSYTASTPLKILLVLLFTIAGQRDAYTWALDHRIHHKFSETDADPHNAQRGFFFSHVGWLFLTPHPKVIEKRKVIDMSDLKNDKVVMFQHMYYIPLFALFSIAFPVLIPWYYWNENLWISFWINFNMRFTCTLNAAFFVNSVAHMWGKKPYDKNISPVESPFVSFLALGEGWHNYHHVFPWDYKTGEFGSYKLNVTTAFIDFCAKIGWASGRKSVTADMIKRRADKCGDGTHFLTDEFAHKDQIWGYGDRDILKEDANELDKMK